jgi:hypothetical protein
MAMNIKQVVARCLATFTGYINDVISQERWKLFKLYGEKVAFLQRFSQNWRHQLLKPRCKSLLKLKRQVPLVFQFA